ncbi:hypothetical protein AB1Y20_022245 [Prymnesium parvum]|uniref:Eukaryotic translation initiation factor 2D n=1 Tax=Prymnesium parvum TaxID=97485 RepID=A0AB34JGY9_PRYPA
MSAFKKELTVKSDQKLSGKDSKKLLGEVERALPGFPASDLLAKRELSLRKPSGGVSAKLYCEGSVPLLFELNGQIFPSLAALWRFPTPPLPALVVPPPVSRFLLSGADLMLPCVMRCEPRGADAPAAGSAACVLIEGNPAAVAVGRLVVGGAALAEALATSPRPKGRCLESMHVFGDALWKYSGKPLPNEGFQSVDGERVVEPLERAEAPPAGRSGGEASGGEVSSCGGLLSRLPPLGGDGGDGGDSGDGGDGGSDGTQGEVRGEAGRPDELDAAAGSEKEEMDELLRACFLQAAHSISPAQLPMTANRFYTHHMRPARPVGSSVDVKGSTYARLLPFLQAMKAEGLCELQLPKSGEPLLCAIHRGAEAYRTFVCWERTAGQAETEAEQCGRPPPLSVSQLYRPREPQRPVFAACGETNRKAYYSAEEAVALLERYLVNEGVRPPANNGDAIPLGPVLTDALFQEGEAYGGGALPTQLPWHSVKQRWLARLELWIRLAGASLEKPKLFAGKNPPAVVISTQQRRGHSVTLVDNVSTFGVEPPMLADELQTALGGRAWVEEDKTVLLQGLWDRAVAEHLVKVHAVPSSFIDNKSAGKAGMSQRKDKKATNIRTT